MQTIARSRFDKVEPVSPGKAEQLIVAAKAGHTNANTLQYINPELDPESAIN
jgi:hypothetical protein